MDERIRLKKYVSKIARDVRFSSSLQRICDIHLLIYRNKNEGAATQKNNFTYEQFLVILGANWIALALLVTENKVFIRTDKTHFLR